MRCRFCEDIPLGDIASPKDYFDAIELFTKLKKDGAVEEVYSNYPLANIYTGFVGNRTKFFHQFRCVNCSTVYGMFVNTLAGGEIKINEKIFDPSEYPDKDEDKKAES